MITGTTTFPVFPVPGHSGTWDSRAPLSSITECQVIRSCTAIAETPNFIQRGPQGRCGAGGSGSWGEGSCQHHLGTAMALLPNSRLIRTRVPPWGGGAPPTNTPPSGWLHVCCICCSHSPAPSSFVYGKELFWVHVFSQLLRLAGGHAVDLLGNEADLWGSPVLKGKVPGLDGGASG